MGQALRALYFSGANWLGTSFQGHVLSNSLRPSSTANSAPDRRPQVELVAGIGAIRSDVRGFARLGALHRELAAIRQSRVTIDLSKLDWFDGHMAVPMRVIVRHAEVYGNSVTFARPTRDVESVLRKNGLLSGLIPDQYRTTMRVTEFGLEAAVLFSMYAKRHLSRKEMPRMSRALQGKFYEGIDELFANSALHSKSPFGVAVGGQFYPKKYRLDFTHSWRMGGFDPQAIAVMSEAFRGGLQAA